MPSRATGRPDRQVFDKFEILRKHPIFRVLDDDLIARLGSFAALKNAVRGTTIFSMGDTGSSLLAVCEGTVRISALSPGGKNTVLNIISPGEVFGEIALFDGGPRTASAVAVTDCKLLIIERRDFVPLLADNPKLAIKIIEVLCNRLRHTSEQVEDIVFLDLPSRLAKTLLRLSEIPGSSKASSKLAITQTEISQMIGASRESTNKQLREWERRKWIQLERGGIILLKRSELGAIAFPESDTDTGKELQ